MTTQYTTILKLALPVQGELSGTWGNVVNDNITQMVEQAVAGKATINSWTGNAHTLTTADGTTSEARCAILDLTDTGTSLTGAGSVVCPTQTKIYIVENNTAQIVTVKTASGTGVAVPVNKTMVVYCDGTNVVEGIIHTNSLSLGTSTTTASSILDEDNLGSNSATALATQQSIKAYVDAQVATADTLTEVLANGNTTSGRDIVASTDDKVQFRDAAIYLNSSTDGQLDIVADTEIQIAATTVDINGAVALNGAITGGTNITISGELDAATLDISGNADIDGTTNLDVVDIDGATQIDATVTVGVDDTGYDVKFFGDTASAYMLWDASADDLILGGAAKLEVATSATFGGVSNGVSISQGAIALKNGGSVSTLDFYCESSNAHYTRLQSAPHASYSGNITLTLPASDGDSGQVLSTNGSGVMSWATVGGAYSDWTILTTTPTTQAAKGQYVCNDTTARTHTLPAGSAGDTVVICNAGSATVTIARTSSQKINSAAEDGTLPQGNSVQLVYVDGTIGWFAI